VVPVLEKADGALLHLDAAGRERPRLHREESDADRFLLRECGKRKRRCQGRGRRTDQEPATASVDRHGCSPFDYRSGAPACPTGLTASDGAGRPRAPPFSLVMRPALRAFCLVRRQEGGPKARGYSIDEAFAQVY